MCYDISPVYEIEYMEMHLIVVCTLSIHLHVDIPIDACTGTHIAALQIVRTFKNSLQKNFNTFNFVLNCVIK